MNAIDWTVIVVYMIGMIGLSVFLSRGQEDQDDYYVGGRNLPWWAVGISTMATQSSAISFISIPAFIALKEGGGFTWLQYELALPLAMILVMVFMIPFFRSLELVSIYEYLEMRYGKSVRYFLSGVFLFSRGLATGVGIYAASLVLSVILGTPLWATILTIGVVTIIYDTFGGMAAVVYSDVIQMFILLFGVFFCIWVSAEEIGGVTTMLDSFPAERLHAIDWSFGFSGESEVPFWGFLIGGVFLYASYYGADQSQVQRELSARTLEDTLKSLILNGLGRFPLTMLYVALGVAAGGLYLHSAELQAAVPANEVDKLIPSMILIHLPHGIKALVISALLAAAMSSIDSSLNSLSAATMNDFIERNRDLTSKQQLIYSKVTTVIWGLIITGMAFVTGGLSDTIIEAINMIGSTFYGPILAAFLMGILVRRIDAVSMIVGVLAGVGVNLGIALASEAHWMWWNFIGFIVAAVVAVVVGQMRPPLEEHRRPYTLEGSDVSLSSQKKWVPYYAILVVYFFAIFGVLLWANSVAAAA
jgi:SSS family solute:Na+ symporter